MEKDRNSSLELLRLISMFFIIMHHYSVHGGYDMLTHSNLSVATIFIQILSIFGKIPCQIFALISGYFLINSNLKNHNKKIIKLILELYIYSIGILLVLYGFNLMPITLKEAIKSFFPLFFENWYVVNYIILLFLLPYLNPFLLNIDKTKYKNLIITLLIIWSVIPTFTNAWFYSDLDFMIIMYIIGAYIKLHYKKTTNNNKNLIISLIFIIILILNTLIVDYIGYKIQNNHLIRLATHFSKLNSIVAVICSIFIVIYCLNIRLNNKLINKLSSTTLGIYLLHDHFLMRKYLWTQLSPNINYVNYPYVHALIKISLVFIISLIIVYIKNKIISKKVDDWMINKINIMFNKIKAIFIKLYTMIK